MVTGSADVTAEPDGGADPGGQEIINERLMALGLVIEWSASMERALRSAFCSLVGSKYAAVVAAGQSVTWLIEQCKALVDMNLEIAEKPKKEILTALDQCKIANDRRNPLVHGAKTASSGSDGSLMTIRSRYRNIKPAVESWTPATIRAAAEAQLMAGLQLFGAMERAVSPEVMVLDDALAWEIQRRKKTSRHDR